MIFILIFINLLLQSLPKFKITITNLYTYRLNLTGILLGFFLILNIINVQFIGPGINLYSGFLQISLTNQVIELFIYLIGSIILIPLMDSFLNQNKTLLQSNINSPSNSSSPNNNISLESIEVADFNKQKDVIQSSDLKWMTYYPLIILFNILGASCLISSFDLLFTYISIELQSFSLYVLSTLNKNSFRSTSAGLKYFLIGGFASCMILLGISLIYSSTGNTNFESLSMLLLNFNSSNLNLWIQSGFIFLILGLLIKLGAAPFHQWAPEVYDKVPTKVTTWIVLIPKLSLFLILFQLLSLVTNNDISSLSETVMSNNSLQVKPGSDSFNVILNTLENIQNISTSTTINNNLIYSELSQVSNISLSLEDKFEPVFSLSQLETDYSIIKNIKEITVESLFKNFLILSSLVSLIIGSLLGLSQIRIKRLLAFSAISHIGFLLLALSINTEIAIESFFFYIVQYILTNLNIFIILLVLGNLAKNNQYFNLNSSTHQIKNRKIEAEAETDINYITELKGIFGLNPILSLSLALCFFSMAGVPPLIGFFGKQQVLYSAISANFIFLSLIAISMSVISAYYYLNVIKISHFDSPNFKLVLKLLLNSTSTKKNYNDNSSALDTAQNPLNINGQFSDKLPLSNIVSLIISILTLILILFIIKPNLFLNSTHILALTLFIGGN